MFWMSERWGYILPIEERYWSRFCRLNRTGKTVHAYVQAGGFLQTNVELVFFYSVHPFKEILGFAEFNKRIVGDSEKLWNSHGQETCLNSYDEYVKLTEGKEKVTFIEFGNLIEASNIVPFDQVQALLGTERMSQIGMYVNKDQADRLVKLLKY